MESLTFQGPPGPDVLGVLITSKCNIVCRHCCNDSHPHNNGAVAFEDVARLIEMARDIPTIKEIGISGGEPFLFVPLLHRIVQYAAGFGFTSSVTTNAFWAKSYDRAVSLLSELKTSGLRGINISTSVFHQDFINLESVINAARSALHVGLRVTINLVSTSSFSKGKLKTILGDLSEQVVIVVMPCLPAGRGTTDVTDEEFVREFAMPPGNCEEHFKKLSVDTSGNIYPCCSPGGFTSPLLMGNVKHSSLRSTVDDSADNTLLAILESVGPQFFLSFLRSANVEPELPEKFSDQCHLCNVILSSESYAQTINQAAEQLFAELLYLPPADTALRGYRLSKLLERRRASQAQADRPSSNSREEMLLCRNPSNADARSV